jgi:hypothetical protein
LSDAQDFTLEVGTQDNYQDSIDWGSAVSPYTGTGQCHFRRSGKLHRFRLQIPAGEVWSNAAGLDLDAVAEGKR